MTRVTVVGLYRSPGHNFVGHFGREPGRHPMESLERVRVLAGRGIEGDRFMDHAPGYKGQVTFYSAETHRDLCEALGKWVEASVCRRNVVVEGVDLNEWVGRRFALDGVAFEGVEECRPCSWMDLAVGPGAEAFLRGRGGLRARVLTDGGLRLGPTTWGERRQEG
jgi:MOSC domain-containing protein YiiM